MGAPARAQDVEPEQSLSLSATAGFGFMRGGSGGLTTAQRAPLCIDVQVLGVRDLHWLVGGDMRLELEDAKAVAGIARVALRHRLGALELRPGAGLPIYLAPRTMVGVEASLGVRLSLSRDFGFLAMLAVSAYLLGSDVPEGTTVIMTHLFAGMDLYL